MRSIAGIALAVAALLPLAAHAKDDYALELCGRSGCKLVRDPIVAAALAHAAEEFGVVAPARATPPYFTVRYVPSTGTTYRLAESALVELQSGSEPRVVDVFDRATAGVEPFDPSDDGVRWWTISAVAGLGLAVAAFAKAAKRRI